MKKEEKKEEYAKGGEIYEELFKDKESDEESDEEKNVIKIAGRRIEIYNQTILNKFQKFDQIEISVLDTYLDRALHIIRQWEALGIVPVNGFPIRFEKREEDIITRDGKKFKKPVNRIVLTKQPEQYRFTKE
ncbi:hypothetical protein LCGC14_0655830 [marine sediment metagenome]|uniref:Uncharacterized protein n=1 Tax=marine sediment metagenome TaxID=412755 RepID=A0A0F9R037_9ZZZZ